MKGRIFPAVKIKTYLKIHIFIQHFQKCNYVYIDSSGSSVICYLNGFLEISARNLNDHDVIKRYIVQVKIGVTNRMLAVSLKFVNIEIF